MDTGGSAVGVEASSSTSAWSGSNFLMLDAMSSHIVVDFWPAELELESGNTVLKSGGVAESSPVEATPPQSSLLMRIISQSEVVEKGTEDEATASFGE